MPPMMTAASPFFYIRTDGTYHRSPVWGDGFQLEVEEVHRVADTRIAVVRARREGVAPADYERFTVTVERGLDRYDLIAAYKDAFVKAV